MSSIKEFGNIRLEQENDKYGRIITRSCTYSNDGKCITEVIFPHTIEYVMKDFLTKHCFLQEKDIVAHSERHPLQYLK